MEMANQLGQNLCTLSFLDIDCALHQANLLIQPMHHSHSGLEQIHLFSEIVSELLYLEQYFEVLINLIQLVFHLVKHNLLYQLLGF